MICYVIVDGGTYGKPIAVRRDETAAREYLAAKAEELVKDGARIEWKNPFEFRAIKCGGTIIDHGYSRNFGAIQAESDL